MIEACAVKNTAQMLNFIGISSGAAGMWKKRKKIPDGSLAKVAERTGVSLVWLKTGEGEMFPEIPQHMLDMFKLTPEENAAADEELKLQQTARLVYEALLKFGNAKPPGADAAKLGQIYDALTPDRQKNAWIYISGLLADQLISDKNS